MDKDYSQKSLGQKLGLDKQKKILIINPPFTFSRYITDNFSSIVVEDTPSSQYSYIHLFTRSQADLEEQFSLLVKNLVKNGMLWISWRKGHCTIATDLNENIVRSIGLDSGLVDVKIVSIDENFSALKFVYRLKDRK